MDYEEISVLIIVMMLCFACVSLIGLVITIYDTMFIEPQADARAVEYCNNLGNDLVPKDVPRYFLSPEPLGISCMKNTYLNIKETDR